MLRRTVSIAAVLVAVILVPAAAAKTSTQLADAALDRALSRLVAMPGGPPGVIALVQRGGELRVHSAGYGDVAAKRRPRATDHMRVASVAKAFSGGVALSLVQRGTLSLDDTIGKWLPDLPVAWHAVTLRQLLNHTSGLPDFSASPAFRQAVAASLTVPPPPRQLLEFVKDDPLNFPPGSRYRYSNSDNIAVGLMVEAATGRSYEDELEEQVARRLGLAQTTLPRGPDLASPYIHGYGLGDDGKPEDISEILASGWAWASGGIVSTPGDLNRFIRGYVGGRLFGPEVRSQQRRFVSGGGSEPRGPGRNAAGLALFQYQTRCGTVYGHTGNTFGFTQFAAASSDGNRSVTVSINLQLTQDSEGQAGAVFRALRRVELLAVCAALAGSAEVPEGGCPTGTSGDDGLCVADGGQAAAAADLVRATFANGKLGAMIVGVWRDGRPLVVGALGDSMTGVPATVDMHHRIGQISATFLTTVFLQLVDEGVLALDDTLDQWFPELPSAAEITLQMLATSTTGYVHYPVTESFLEAQYADPFRAWEPEELVAFATAEPLSFEPGTSWQFADTNLVLLGMVIEKATGTSLHALIEERILAPLDLDDTVSPTTADQPEPVLHGFTGERGVWEDATFWNPSWVPFAGDMASNQDDIRRWLEAVGSGELLSPESHQAQLAPTTVGLGGNTPERYYAMGVGVTNGWVVHNPSLQGYRGTAGHLADENLTIVIFNTLARDTDQDVRPDSILFDQLGSLLAPNHAPQLAAP